MKKEKLIMLVFVIVFFLFFIKTASAFEMVLSSPRTTYQPYETFQAEIKFDVPPANKIANANILLENERGIPFP